MPRLRTISLLASLVGAVGVAAPAVAGAVTIGFDDLPPGRVTLNDQYAAQGVTFNDLTAIDDAERAPGFARSPTRSVEACFAAEFCSQAFEADFTTAQRRVKVWLGASFPVTAPLTVHMAALDASGATVASADAVLPIHTFLTPVGIPLGISLGSSRIRKVLITQPGGVMNGIAVDDLEFSRAGPPPPCTATSVPTVALTQPSGSGLTVLNNGFLLAGTVAPGGSRVTSATIVDHSAGPISGGSLYGDVIQPTGGSFGPIYDNGLLTPGKNTLFVTATNCLGTSAPAVVQVEYTPVPPGAGFLLDGIEVVQTVQSFGNGVPLIASSANGVKRTIARVYLRTTGSKPTIPRVTATLLARRADGTLVGAPVTVTSSNVVTVDGSGDVTAERHDMARSLNFELPASWLGAGRLHLELGHVMIDGVESHLPCTNCDNEFGNGTPATVTLHATPPLRIVLVGVPYRVPPDTALHVPRQKDFDMLASWLRRAYPASDVEITQAQMGIQASPPTDCEQLNYRIADWAALAAWQPAGTRYYGVVSDDNGAHFMRGCSTIGGTFGSGPTGSGTFGWDTDGSYGDWYGGHEIGHLFGRLHPGACGESNDDDNFPYPFGLIGYVYGDFLGYDVGDPTFGIAGELKDWRAGWSDVMTYCKRQWISSYTYDAILSRLCSDEADQCPDADVLRHGTAKATVRASRKTLNLSVVGNLVLATDALTLAPLQTATGLTPTPRVRGSYAVELLDARGRVLARYPFTPQVESDPPPGAQLRAVVHVVAPFLAGTARVAVLHGARVLATRAVSDHVPTVRLLTPTGVTGSGRQVTVRWRMHDDDGGALTATVLFAGDGVSFVPIANDVHGSSLRVDLRTLAGGPGSRFRVVVSDGVRASSATSTRPLKLDARRPIVHILSGPVVARAGQPISLLGQVSDPLDGHLAPRRLVWRSGRTVLGHGLSLAVRLRAGRRIVTLTATNAAGVSATARVRVTVKAAVPVVGGGQVGAAHR